MKPLTIYVDTSVFGGMFDEEFDVPSKAFFHLVRCGRFELLVSDISRREIALAPPQVQKHFEETLGFMRLVVIDEEVLALRDAYVAAGIVSEKSADDAAHVAVATIAKADLIVSWNFKHMVHVDKIRAYNSVNITHGYQWIDIRSPLEVIDYEETV